MAGYVIVSCFREKKWLLGAGIALTALSMLADFFCRFIIGQVHPFEITTAIGLFCILISLPSPVRLLRPFRLLSEMSYGVYLSHCIFVSAFVRLTAGAGLPLWADPFLTAGAVLLAELLLMGVVKKLRLRPILA